MADNCIFCKIGRNEIPVQPIYEDEEFIAFPDLHPQAPVHLLLIPRAHFATIMDIDDSALLGRALHAIQQTARLAGLTAQGFRTVLNCGVNGGQTVYHVHWHLLGGREMAWPPG